MPNQKTQSSDQSDAKFEKKGKTYPRLSAATDADTQVRQTEDASLQDDSYSFDESNTDNEEYHDVDDDSSELTDLFQSDDDLQ
jgi:hypothetical protein